jgi:hypothetical protein
VFGLVAAVGQIENDGFAVAFFAVAFVEDWFGDYILFAGPISQVAFAATFTAKWEFRMHGGIGGGFTYWAFVFHVSCLGCYFPLGSNANSMAARGIHLDAAASKTDSLNDLARICEEEITRGFY